MPAIQPNASRDWALLTLANHVTTETVTYGRDTVETDDWDTRSDARDDIVHAMIHLRDYRNGDNSEDHLGHALTRVAMAMYKIRRDLDEAEEANA